MNSKAGHVSRLATQRNVDKPRRGRKALEDKRRAEIEKMARLIFDLARALGTKPEKVLERLTRKGDRK